VQLAESVDDGLVAAGRVLQAQARVLVDQLREDLPHPLLVAGPLGFDGDPVHRLRKRQRREVDVVVLGGVVQHRVEADLVDLGDGGDVAGHRLRHLDVVLALQHEEAAHLERLAAVADVEEAVARDGALVHAEHAHAADERVDRDLEDVGQDMAGGVGHGDDRLGGVALAAQELRRVGLARMRQDADDDVEQLADAGARP
jgi:hypothetical protein